MDSSVALHLGVDVAELRRVTALVSRSCAVEGDGWEVWAEPVGTAGNDDRTLHVVVTTTPNEADLLVVAATDLLVALRESTVVAVETPLDDWSIDAGGRLWHRITRVDGTTSLVVEYVSPSL
jgi:hypothetical protein